MAHNQSDIAARFCAGEPLDHIPVVDFHAHIAPSSEYYFIPKSNPAEVVAYLDRFGVDHIVAFSISTTSDPRAGNAIIFDVAEKYPQRVTALIELHAAFPEDWLALLEEGCQHGARGIKLISQYQEVPEATIDWSPAFDYARNRQWVVLHHYWGTVERLEKWAEAYPELVFIIGHASIEFKAAIEKYDNLYQCTCAQLVMRNCMTENMVRHLPSEKILYGSDTLDLDLGTGIGPVALAAIPEAMKEMILGGNAVRLMEQLEWPVAKIKRG